MIDTIKYTVGGTVQAGGGIYIHRQADEELLQLCYEGTFAYVLTARQLGKSSLMMQTAMTLSEEGIRPVVIDLTRIGGNVTAEEWLFGFLLYIVDDLDIETDLYDWWEENRHIGNVQRLVSFFENVVLKEVQEPIVIFVDEIDTTLVLDFTDDFFAAIRHFYNARSLNEVFKKLSFVLIGVATPNDLIRDRRRTPFNIGERVDLTDFTVEEVAPLVLGLSIPKANQEEVANWVLDWTGGHPYLTQRLLRALAEKEKQAWTRKEVDLEVYDTFLGEASQKDNNLQFVRDRMKLPTYQELGVHKLYKSVLRNSESVPDDPTSISNLYLKLSGIVKPASGFLSVRNKIYREVFGIKWLQ